MYQDFPTVASFRHLLSSMKQTLKLPGKPDLTYFYLNMKISSIILSSVEMNRTGMLVYSRLGNLISLHFFLPQKADEEAFFYLSVLLIDCFLFLFWQLRSSPISVQTEGLYMVMTWHCNAPHLRRSHLLRLAAFLTVRETLVWVKGSPGWVFFCPLKTPGISTIPITGR